MVALLQQVLLIQAYATSRLTSLTSITSQNQQNDPTDQTVSLVRPVVWGAADAFGYPE